MLQLCALPVLDSRKGVRRDSCPRWLTGVLHWVPAGAWGCLGAKMVRCNWWHNYAHLDSPETSKLSWPLRGRSLALRCCHLEGLLVAMQPHRGLGERGKPWQLQVGTGTLVSYWQRGRKL